MKKKNNFESWNKNKWNKCNIKNFFKKNDCTHKIKCNDTWKLKIIIENNVKFEISWNIVL